MQAPADVLDAPPGPTCDAAPAFAWAPQPPDGAALPRPPDGTDWPTIAVIADDHGAGLSEATRRSFLEQRYPGACLIPSTQAPDETADAAFARMRAAADTDFVLRLGPDDLLPPGALLAAALATVTDGADAIIGLRVVLQAGGSACADVIDLAAGLAPWCDIPDCGGILIARAPSAAHATVAVIGRPLLIHRGAGGAPAAPKLRIAALAEDVAGGGASIAHARLIQALRLAGDTVEALTLPASPATAEWTDTFPEAEARVAAGSFDVLLAGNIHGATRRADVLARMHRHVPVSAVTHDVFLLTGRCDASVECAHVHDRCTASCPAPTAYPYLAPGRIEAAWQGKRDFLRMVPPPLLLANSAWSGAFARAVLGPALSGIVREVALAFPTQVFRPQDRRGLRALLGLPQDDFLILFAAANSDNPQKGLADVLDAMRDIAGPGVGFVVVGRVDDPAALTLPNLFAPGPVADEERLAAWYGACDLHVTASRFESCGQTPIEAGLCGTPTVAYRRTGLSTAVIDGVSGRLTDPDPANFLRAIRALAADRVTRENLGALGRVALESRNSFAASYLTLLAAWRAHGIVAPAVPGGRVRFTPDILRTYALAQDRLPGARGIIAGPPRRSVRLARRAKHAIWGRRLPLWMRLAVRTVRRVRHAD